MVMEVLNVHYHDHHVGAASFDPDTGLGAFEYTPAFVKTGIELSPLKMPLSRQIYTFPDLNNDTFKCLPGLIADSLPDDFGNAVLNAWVAGKGKQPADITKKHHEQFQPEILRPASPP
jgi:serine/threonine-protein kinase HipA